MHGRERESTIGCQPNNYRYKYQVLDDWLTETWLTETWDWLLRLIHSLISFIRPRPHLDFHFCGLAYLLIQYHSCRNELLYYHLSTMVNAISTLIGEKLHEGIGKYWGTVACINNGCIYGIPLSARRVIKFNPVDKSITYIGPDFGGR